MPVVYFRFKVSDVHGDVVFLHGVQMLVVFCLDACWSSAAALIMMIDSCESSVARTIEPVRPRMCPW